MANFRSATAIACRSNTKGTSVGWILFSSPLLIILQRVVVCVFTCIYGGIKNETFPFVRVPLLQVVINRPRNFVNSSVYTNDCTPKSKEISSIYIYIFVIRGKISIRIILSRETHKGKKVQTFSFVRDLYNSREKIQGVDREKSYYFRSVIDRLNRLIFTDSRC